MGIKYTSQKADFDLTKIILNCLNNAEVWALGRPTHDW